MDPSIPGFQCAFDWDHRDPATKLNNVSTLAGNEHSYEVILNEINKCDLLCANCHSKRTYEQKALCLLNKKKPC